MDIRFLSTRTFKKPIASRYFAVFLGASFFFPATAVEPSKEVRVISLSDAVAMTLNNHPDLKALVAEESVWKGKIQQAGIGIRPQVSLMLEDAMGTGDYSATKNMQSTMSFSWLLQKEQLDTRVKSVQNAASQLALDKQIKALDLASIVAKNFINILVAQERLELNEAAVKQAVEVTNVISKRVKAGKGSVAEEQLAQVELSHRKLTMEDTEHQLDGLYYRLTALIEGGTSNFIVSGNLLEVPAIPSVTKQLTKLQQTPGVKRLANAQRLAQSRIELARIEAKPQWQFSAGLRRYEATDDFGFVASVAIPWGDNNQNAGKVAALRAEQQVLAREQEGLLKKLDVQLYVLLQEMKHSEHVIQTIRNDIIPSLESALTESKVAFERGQLNYNQYSSVRRELLNAQSKLLSAFESLHLQHIEIQRLTGTSITQ